MKRLLHKIRYSHRLSTADPANMDKDQLKQYTRRGFDENDDHRLLVWKIAAGLDVLDSGLHRRARTFYQHAVKDVFHEAEIRVHVAMDQIPTFGSSISWSSNHFSKTMMGPPDLDKVGRLCCVLRELADVRYNPIIPALTLVIVKFIEEHEAYAILASLVKLNDGKYFDKSESQSNLTIWSLENILELKLPTKLWQHMTKITSRSSRREVFMDWIHALFTNWLQPIHVCRVVDVFLLEGSKVLYRFAYGILKLHSEIILGSRDEPSLWESIKDALKSSQFNFNELLLVSFSQLNLRRREIEMSKENISNAKLLETSGFGSMYLGTRIPRMHGYHSKLITVGELRSVLPYLPARLRVRDLKLIFTTDRDGYNLNTFYKAGAPHGPSFMMIQLKDCNTVIGCFASHAWRIHSKPFGNRHCFIFRFSRGDDDNTKSKSINAIQNDNNNFSSNDNNNSNKNSGKRSNVECGVEIYQTIPDSETINKISDGSDDLDEDELWIQLPTSVFGDSCKYTTFPPEEPLGIQFIPDIHGAGAIVKNVIPGGMADRMNVSIFPGDVLISVNDSKMLGLTYDKIIEFLNSRRSSKSDTVIALVTHAAFMTSLFKAMASTQLSAATSAKLSAMTNTNESLLPPELNLGEIMLDGDVESGEITDSVITTGDKSESEIEFDDGDGISSRNSVASSHHVTPSLKVRPSFTGNNSPVIYMSKPKKLYMQTHEDFFQLGSLMGKSDEAALRIFKDLSSGTSYSTDVFDNPILSGDGKSEFLVNRLELFTFVLPFSNTNQESTK